MFIRFVSREISNPWVNVRSWLMLLGLTAFVALARLAVPSRNGATIPGLWLPACPLRSYTGISCPFCGLTTATAWLARGHVLDAWRSNILSPLLGIMLVGFAVYVLGCRLLAGRAFELRLDRPARSPLGWLAAALLAISWAINLYRL